MNKVELMDITRRSDELKKLITEHPDCDTVVLVETALVDDYSYAYVHAPSICYTIEEILDVEAEFGEGRIYADRDDFENDLWNALEDMEEYVELNNEEFEKVFEKELEKYDPYWKKVIVITAGV